MQIARVAASAHSHIASTFIAGFKTLFWSRALTPTLLATYTHLFLFDSDMVVRPSQFDLVGLLRVQEQTNASIIGADHIREHSEPKLAPLLLRWHPHACKPSWRSRPAPCFRLVSSCRSAESIR